MDPKIGDKNILRQFLSPLPALGVRYDSGSLVCSLLLIGFLAVIFVIFGLELLQYHTNPEQVDTQHYLGEANLLRRNGGAVSFFHLAVTGRYEQANQHPLYILLLTPFASTDISFFVTAKLLSLAVGVALLVVVFAVARKRYGDLVATVATAGLLMTHAFEEWSTFVASESLLMFVSFLCMHFILTGFRDNRQWLYAGFFAGLAYLAKGTGLFLIPAFPISLLITHRWNIFKNRYFYLFFAAFALVASPLLVRNMVLYDNPFFNINIYNVDRTKTLDYTLFSPERGAGIHVYESIQDTGAPAVAAGFTKAYGLTKKIIAGLPTELLVFLKTLAIRPISYWSTPIQVTFGAFVFVFFVFGLIRAENVGGRIYVVTTLLIFFAALSLFRSYERYLLPLIPLVWIYAALGALTLLDLVRANYVPGVATLRSILAISLLSGCVLVIGYLLATRPIPNPMTSVDYGDSRRNLINWLQVTLKKQDRYAEGPMLNWMLDEGTQVLPPPKIRTNLIAFNEFAKKHQIKYVVLEWYSLTISRFRGSGYDRRKFIQEYFDFDQKRGIVQRKPVPGWRLVYKDNNKKVDFLVFQIDS
jgi:Dolichyl-phosphate-mannose-protein mannosyltransferase